MGMTKNFLLAWLLITHCVFFNVNYPAKQIAICIETHNSAMQISASQLNSAHYFADCQLNSVFAGFQLNSARKQ